MLSQTEVEDEIKMEFTNFYDIYDNKRRIQRGLTQPSYWAINRSKNLADPLIELSSGANDTDNNLYRADSIYEVQGPHIGDDVSGLIYMGERRPGDTASLNFSSSNKFSADRVPKINIVENRIKVSTANNSREYERDSNILEMSNLEIVAESKKIKKVLNPSKLNIVTAGDSTLEKTSTDSGYYLASTIDIYTIDQINLSNPPKFLISGAGVLYFGNSQLGSGSLKITSSGISKDIDYGLLELSILGHPSCSVAVYDGDLIEFNAEHSSLSTIIFMPYSTMTLGLYDKSISGIVANNPGVSDSGASFYKYELVSGDGSNDNSRFSIINNWPNGFLVWNEDSTGLTASSQLSVRIRAKNAEYGTIIAENSITFSIIPASNKTLSLPSNIHPTIQDKLIICRGDSFVFYSMYGDGARNIFVLKPFGKGVDSVIDPYKQVNIKENLNMVYEFKIIGETEWNIFLISSLHSQGTNYYLYLSTDDLYFRSPWQGSFIIPSCKDVQFRCYICDGKPDSLGPLGSGPYIYSDIIKFLPPNKLDCDDSSVFEPSNFYVSFDP